MPFQRAGGAETLAVSPLQDGSGLELAPEPNPTDGPHNPEQEEKIIKPKPGPLGPSKYEKEAHEAKLARSTDMLVVMVVAVIAK